MLRWEGILNKNNSVWYSSKQPPSIVLAMENNGKWPHFPFFLEIFSLVLKCV